MNGWNGWTTKVWKPGWRPDQDLNEIEEGHSIGLEHEPSYAACIANLPILVESTGLIEHLGLDMREVQVNAMRTKKDLSFTNGWNKVPVFTDEEGEVVVDSTPIMNYIDEKYNKKCSAKRVVLNDTIRCLLMLMRLGNVQQFPFCTAHLAQH